MAYLSKDLSVLAYANGFTIWHYTTKDETVTSNSYFTPAETMLRVGDILFCNVGNESSFDMVLVISKTRGVSVRSLLNGTPIAASEEFMSLANLRGEAAVSEWLTNNVEFVDELRKRLELEYRGAFENAFAKAYAAEIASKANDLGRRAASDFVARVLGEAK